MDRIRAEHECRVADIMDVGKSAAKALTGVAEPFLNISGAFDTPSKDTNTSTNIPQGKTEAISEGSGWIVLIDENGTIIDSVSCGY